MRDEDFFISFFSFVETNSSFGFFNFCTDLAFFKVGVAVGITITGVLAVLVFDITD